MGNLNSNIVHPREVFKSALLGIDVLDHVILGDSGHISLKDEGLID